MPRWVIAVLIGVVVLLIAGGVFMYVVFRSVGEGLEEPLRGLGESVKGLGESFDETFGCKNNIPFEATYVPPGFDKVARCPKGSSKAVAWWRSDHGSSGAIEVYEGKSPLAQTHRRPITVLNDRGTIGVIHDGFSVEFDHEEFHWVLVTYGIPLNELERFAKNLIPVP